MSLVIRMTISDVLGTPSRTLPYCIREVWAWFVSLAKLKIREIFEARMREKQARCGRREKVRMASSRCMFLGP
jgi:hypothetical protein